MYKTTSVTVLAMLLLLTAGTACTDQTNEWETEMENSHQVSIATRTATAESINYPLTLYAFNPTSGALVTSTTAETESEALQLTLNTGNYRLVAIAGTGNISLTESPTLSSDIGISQNSMSETAIQMGIADISPMNEDMDANITLKYQVSRVNLTLKDIPSSITAIQAIFEPLYNNLNFAGEFSGNTSATISLTATDNASIWASGTHYLYPGITDNPLKLTFTLKTGEESESYTYTHESTLKAGTPYTLTGTYKRNIIVNGNIDSEGWKDEEGMDFDFGTNTDGDESSTGSENGEFIVATIPGERSIWNGHFVATRSSSNTPSELLLMSLKEWDTTPENAASIPSTYTENELTNWRIPTAEEMIAIATKVGNSYNLNSSNTKILDSNGDALSNAELYLCENATKTILMNQNFTNNAMNGTNCKLRLVKTITVKTE